MDMARHTYDVVQQMIHDGESEERIEAILSDDTTPLTDAQIADLRAELAEVQS